MNNSVFGKTQENLRNRVNVELVTDARLLRKRVTNPTFYRGKPIAECLTIIQSKVATLTLNRPIYVGFTVLELLKLHKVSSCLPVATVVHRYRYSYLCSAN